MVKPSLTFLLVSNFVERPVNGGDMKAKQLLILGVTSLGLGSLLFIASTEFRSSDLKKVVSFQTQVRDNQYKAASNKSKASDNDGILISASHQGILDYSRRQNAPAKKEMLNDLEDLVAQEKARYEQIFNQYKSAIKAYEMLSSNFDELIRDKAPINARSAVDREMQKQAQEILDLQQETNIAYTALMAKYDEVVPIIVANYF